MSTRTRTWTIKSTGKKYSYRPIDESTVHSRARFDVPQYYAGQTVEYAWADIGERGEAGLGSLYLRVTDQSLASSDPERVTYYQRIGR